MKLEKAIEELKDSLDESIPTLREYRRNAIKLGIEALKRCKYIAEHTDRWSGVLLPGETK